jgi:DNA-binding MarR family transcriptional regulator
VVEVALHQASQDQTFRDRAVIVRIPEDSTAITRYCDLLREVLAVLAPDAPAPPPPERQSRIAELLDDRVVILAIENLDRVFHDIGLEGQRNLRAWVETSRQVLLLATTPTLFAGVTDRSKPWYGGLATLMLPALTAEEGQELVALLAEARGDQELSAFVKSNTGRARINAVAQLTGGSPRVWMVLASVATKESLDELFPAVEELLESMVPYYQQLLWSLSPNERRLVVALAQTGRMTVKQVAEAAEIEPQSAATTLRRLTEGRWVEAEQPRSGDRRVTHYRVREPLLRYHLQYRQESSQPIGLVVMILKGFFSDRERGSSFARTNPDTLTTLNAIADRASDFSDITPVAVVVEESKNAQVVSALVLAAWRLGGEGPAPESPPTEGWLGSLLFRTARAAAGHEQDRSDLPPEVLSILDSIDGDRNP